MTRTTDDWAALLDGWVYDKQPGNLLGARERFAKAREQEKAAPEAVAELVRLRRYAEMYISDLREDRIYAYGKDGPLTKNQVESLAYDLTRILNGDTE